MLWPSMCSNFKIKITLNISNPSGGNVPSTAISIFVKDLVAYLLDVNCLTLLCLRSYFKVC